MRPPATPAMSIAIPRSTTTSGFSPMRRAQSAPTAVAKRKPERRRTKYDGKLTSANLNSSGRIDLRLGLHRGLMRRRAGFGDARSLLRGEHIDRHETHADADRDVRHVEGGPVVVVPLVHHVHVDEIDDVTVADPVEH